MNSVVWKFELELRSGVQRVGLPRNSKVLSFDVQHDIPCIWALVDPEPEGVSGVEERQFVLTGTGHTIEVPAGRKLLHVGTALHVGGTFVWHVFELIDARKVT